MGCVESRPNIHQEIKKCNDYLVGNGLRDIGLGKGGKTSYHGGESNRFWHAPVFCKGARRFPDGILKPLRQLCDELDQTIVVVYRSGPVW